MAVAKSGYIHDRLRRMLHSEGFRREYRAVCVGCPEPPAGIIDAPIGRDETSTVRRDGAAGRTVRRQPVRGAVHPERAVAGEAAAGNRPHPSAAGAHGVHLGYPLAGDWLYGTEAPALIPRPALHACALTLTHPVTGEVLHFTAPIPEDMQALI